MEYPFNSDLCFFFWITALSWRRPHNFYVNIKDNIFHCHWWSDQRCYQWLVCVNHQFLSSCNTSEVLHRYRQILSRDKNERRRIDVEYDLQSSHFSRSCITMIDRTGGNLLENVIDYRATLPLCSFPVIIKPCTVNGAFATETINPKANKVPV